MDSINNNERHSAYHFLSKESNRFYTGIGRIGPEDGILEEEYYKVLGNIVSARIKKGVNELVLKGQFITLELILKSKEVNPKGFHFEIMFREMYEFLNDLGIEDTKQLEDVSNIKFSEIEPGLSIAYQDRLTNLTKDKPLELIIAKPKNQINKPEFYLLALSIPKKESI